MPRRRVHHCERAGSPGRWTTVGTHAADRARLRRVQVRAAALSSRLIAADVHLAAHYSDADERIVQQADSKYYSHHRADDEPGTPPHGSPRFNQHIEHSEAIDAGFVGSGGLPSEAPPTAELLELTRRCSAASN